MAPHGRFVELGKKDIIDNNNLPMQPFLRNVSYIAVDIDAIVEERPRLLADSLTEISKLLADKRLHPIRPLKTFEFSKFGEAIHHMLSGRSVGKVVLVKEPNPSLPVMLQTETSLYSSNKSYIIAGGLGGVGRSIASWMVEHGARYLVLISRSGPSNLADKRFVEELQARGVTVKAPACDIADAGSLQSVIETVKNSMPPIAGCIQAAMVLKVSAVGK
jgi:NADPH:quinone reductase-like Zn-dependent oxidoreductase